MNVITDLYLISIPLPMLWQSSLKPLKKFGLIIIFSGGLFIIVCALIRAIFIVTVSVDPFFLVKPCANRPIKNPVNGAQQAGSWAVRETFVAVITTNMPIVFPFIRSQVTPIFDSLVQSVRGSTDKKSVNGTPRSLITWGGGGKQSWRGRGPRTPNPITEFTFSESEEHMLNQSQFRMHEMSPNTDGNNIRKDTEIAVVTVPRGEEKQHTRCQGNIV